MNEPCPCRQDALGDIVHCRKHAAVDELLAALRRLTDVAASYVGHPGELADAVANAAHHIAKVGG